ncbi:ornithine cyclodeaminase family protein [Rhizobium sp. C4]|uniref:ornithine cyclodeaminase family protein n=1 Tax=Rhizobium sp. C4 TaxID=1349800 RepID=UPI001E2E0DED|nr:ornithine cyclodeaminase family protein [Rhizobium sp. C4]MCD2174639.1 ornithine cyclodeaminase family protein [Rhizobium sp. C4]
MLILDETEVRNTTAFPELVEAVRSMFQSDCRMPTRHHHSLHVPAEPDATLLLMPAWTEGQYMGVKIVSVFPGNVRRALPSVSGTYLLSSALTGQNLAIIDGAELTARRTAASSALASRFLSRTDAKVLLVCGTGRLSLNLIEAHCSQRPIETVLVWGRSAEKAEETVKLAGRLHPRVSIVTDLAAAVAEADIISCATLSDAPIVRGAWLKPGAHLDLIGAFTPSMRECDDEAVLRASLFVDTFDGALSEGGDLVQPMKAGLIARDSIRADLAGLSRGDHVGRTSADEITLFKSVGAALEDLAGAILAFETATRLVQSDG